MKKYILILSLYLPCLGSAQEMNLDRIISQIEFGQDSVESIFLWVTDNIRYDSEKKDELDEERKSRVRIKGSQSEYEKELLTKVLQTKKGVCQDYSILMNALLKHIGYQCIYVSGYTKNSKGKINGNGGGHAWNAVKVNGEWQLYDATWAAGSVKDGSKFVKKYSPQWHHTDPEVMIKTHMPFDPIWQLLSNPVSYDDFKSSKFVGSKNKTFYSKRMIDEHFEKSKSSQSQAALERSQKMGEPNPLVKRWQSSRMREMKMFTKKSNSEQLKAISEGMKLMTAKYNEYVDAKNKKFSSGKWTLDYASSFIFGLKTESGRYQKQIDLFEPSDADEKRFIIKTSSFLAKFKKQIDSEAEFLIIQSIKNKKK